MTLLAVIAFSIVLGMLASAMIGLDGSAVRAEVGTRPQEELVLPSAPATAPSLALPAFAGLVEQAIPAVVSITSIDFQSGSDPHEGLDDPIWNWFFRRQPELEDEGQQPERPPRRSESGGSGFVISSNGYILTNHHVVEDADRVDVAFSDGSEREAYVMGTDPAIDLALLKVEAEGLPTLALGDSEALRVGEWVVAIGNPVNFDHSVTVGVVSGKGRRFPLGGTDYSLSEFIQTDAAINFGNSGGPLINTRGEVVGINTAITRSGSNGVIQGIGFALPINKARSVLDQLRETGRVSRGYLGVNIEDVNDLVQESYGLDEARGALVQTVEPNTPAEEAGLQPGDLILGLDGQTVRDTQELIGRISELPPGETVHLDLLRGGERIDLDVILGDRELLTGRSAESRLPEPEPEDDEVVEMGFTVEPLGRQELRQMGVSGLEGVLVTAVDADSAAWEAGLRRGVAILEVNRQPVRDLSDYREALEKVESGSVLQLRIAVLIRRGEVGERFLFFRVP
jgi:serine protease Do